ncbi:putative Fe-S cluster assembly protein SufT [Gammaproteobacteria bacterium AB-CW1]|uniref:Fe-S cluster assembly protein SufT n=1 Tax=Natronospira elongata TaxID=3110268 RepID=A0AAP6MMN5_9GAMM|nr:putative Fe-S cluster assembly protein SufT [Gammaproteobacteria bacterium AB-CW1]
MYTRGDPIALTRDCEAVLIPSGSRVVIPENTEVVIAQALGGSYTVYVSGNMARIGGHDADALGIEPEQEPELDADASEEELEKFCWERMATCYDPEIPINIVDLGLVYQCDLTPIGNSRYHVNVQMTLTAPGCGMGDVLAADVQQKLERITQIEKANVELVFDPPWHRDMMSDEAKLQTGML